MDKLYTVTTPGPIPGLDNIVGPLTTPMRLSKINVLEMLKNNYEVYEHNPSNKTEKVRVTRYNINSIKFNSNRAVSTSKRKLNRSIQEMSKPVMVEPVKKEEKSYNNYNNNNKKNKNFNKKDEKLQNNVSTTPEVVEEKIETPTSFEV